LVTFICSLCGMERTGVRRRCYVCHPAPMPTAEEIEATRQRMVSVHAAKSQEERSAQARRMAAAVRNPFDVGAYSLGKPSLYAKPIGSTRPLNGHTQIKCEDGKWRYRARVVWAVANGPIPNGYLIHHRNENPNDDRLENLQCVTRSEHMRIHSTPDRMRARQKLGVVARKQNAEVRGRY